MNFTYFLPFCKSKSAATEDLMGQVEKNLMLNLYPLLITLSTAGNLANLAVYRHEFLRSSTTIRTLAAKAVANTLSLYCVLPNYLKSIPQLTNNPSINWFYWNSLPYTMFNTNTFATFAIWLTVIMSLERYLLVAFPIRSRNWCTMRNTYTAMILTFLGSICLQIPTILARQLFSAECLNNESQSIKIYAYTVPRKYRQLENTYYYLYSLMTIIMPMLILASTTLSINYHLFWSRKKLTCGGTNGASMEQKLCITRLSLATTLCHLIFETPHIVVFVRAAVRTSDVAYWKNYQALTAWANILSMVNGALPFFVYSACSPRFRNIAIAQFLGPKGSIHDPTGQHASAIVLSNRGKCSGNGRNGSTNSVSLIKSLKRQSLTRLLSSGPSSAAAIFDTSIPKILNASDKTNSEKMESVI